MSEAIFGYIVVFAVGVMAGMIVMGFVAGGKRVMDRIMITEILSHKVYLPRDKYMEEIEQVLRNLLIGDE